MDRSFQLELVSELLVLGLSVALILTQQRTNRIDVDSMFVVDSNHLALGTADCLSNTMRTCPTYGS